MKTKIKKRHNYFTSFLLRLFIASAFILSFCIVDLYYGNIIKNEINKNMNLGALSNYLIKTLGVKEKETIVLNDVYFDKIEYADNINYFYQEYDKNVYAVESGIVINKNKNEIWIQSINGVIYHYLEIDAINKKIYEQVTLNEVIGITNNEDSEECYYKVEILCEDGSYSSYYE